MYSERGWSEEVEWIGALQAQVRRLQAQVDELMHAHGCIHCEADGCPALRAAARARGQQRLRHHLPTFEQHDVAHSVSPTAWWSQPPNL